MKYGRLIFLFLVCVIATKLSAEEQEMNITSVDVYETSTNRSFKVTIDGNPVFFRVGRDHPEKVGINREREIENYKFAEKLGLAPTLLGYHLKNGLLMTQFIDGAPPSMERIREHEMLDTIVHLLKKLHNNSANEGRPAEKTIFSVNDDLLNTLTALGIEPGEEENIKRWQVIRQAFEHGYYKETSMAICHGDLHHVNLLETEGRVYIIDWEYSFYGYIIDDLGKFCASNWLSHDEIKYLADAYWGHASPENIKKLHQNIFMQHLNFFLWCQIQAHQHPELAPLFREIVGYAQRQLNEFVPSN